MSECQEQGQPAALPFRQGPHFLVGIEFHLRAKPFSQRGIPLGVEAADPVDDLTDPHPGVHGLILGHVADPLPDPEGIRPRIDTGHLALPVVAPQQAQEDADQGGLTGPVETEKAEDRAGRDV